MNTLKRIAFVFVSCIVSLFATAQSATQRDEPTDFMRSDGKIYVVVAVIVVIVIGLFLYLANLDKKITKLEKDSNKH